MNDDPDDIRASRFARIGALVRAHADAIVDKWSDAARSENESARYAHRDELRNELPLFLVQVGAELASWGNGHERQRTAAAVSHGRERWRHGWRLSELVEDYQILRIVMLSFLDEHIDRPLNLDETKAVGVLLDDAIRDAVVTYVDHQDLHLEEAERRSRGTFENAAVGIGHLDLNASWLRANERLCRMLGYTLDELKQTALERVTYRDDWFGRQPQLDLLLEGSLGHLAWEARFVHRDGRRIWTNVTVSVQRNAERQPRYFIVVVEDITERKRLDAALQRAMVAAEEGNRLKSEFVANVSHEIRTPMNAILGMTELALDEDLSNDVRDYVSTAHESAKSLLSLVNDLLDFSRMEAGKLELEAVPFDLWDSLGETAKALSLNASEKGLELLTDVDADVPRFVCGDRLRLRQVITNLVSNAVKFTEQGEVVLRVALERQTVTQAYVRFSVHDTGIGVSAEDQQRIFAPFTQADASTTRVFGGSGLGLAICSELIRQFGGALKVRSELGEGSEFYFTACFELAEPPDGLAESRRARIDRLCDKRVLVVDDNATNRTILERTLKPLTRQVDVLDDGAAAIHRLRQAATSGSPYDFVLIDALMPGCDGFTVIEQINQDPDLHSTLVLMLSSADRSTFIDRTRKLQVDGFLDKPVMRRDLLDLLSQTDKGSDAPERQEDPETPISRVLRILVVEDTPANQKVVQAILQKRGHSVTIANNGREAIDKLYVETFDVILMDVQMPTVDGYQATAAIREMEEPPGDQIPIIAMTAHAMRGDAEKCLAVGMNDYISKPIDSGKLIHLVEKWGVRPMEMSAENESGERTSTSESAEEPRETMDSSDRPIADFAQTLKRFAGIHGLVADMIQFFREDVPGLLREIEEGLAQSDTSRVRRAAHSVKGLSSNFDAWQVVETSLQMEELATAGDLDSIPDLLPQLKEQIERLELAFQEYERSV